jgi:hypothetical protein
MLSPSEAARCDGPVSPLRQTVSLCATLPPCATFAPPGRGRAAVAMLAPQISSDCLIPRQVDLLAIFYPKLGSCLSETSKVTVLQSSASNAAMRVWTAGR